MSVVELDRADDAGRYGGKAAELGSALRADLPVPGGLAFSHDAVEAIATADREPSNLLDRVRRLDGPYVVRSSGVEEDGAEASFAGQHLTVVNVVEAADVLDALERIFESARSDAVVAYRSELGIDAPPRIGAVVQTLVTADKSGVLFTRNPVDGSHERVIEAAWGLGEAVVDAKVTPDTVRLRPGGDVIERRAGTKDVQVVPAPAGGTRTVSVPDAKQARLCLTNDELQTLDRLARQVEAYRDGGHDIEWAFAEGDPYLLQRRDITTE